MYFSNDVIEVLHCCAYSNIVDRHNDRAHINVGKYTYRPLMEVVLMLQNKDIMHP
jgi:hypothetical protein